MAEKKKVLVTTYFYCISSNKYLLLLISFIVISLGGLVLITINVVDSTAGYGYAKNNFENSININSWIIPNNESVYRIISSEIFNYTTIKTLTSYYVSSVSLQYILLFGVFLFLLSSVLPAIVIDTYNSSETKYSLIVLSGGKAAYFGVSTIVSTVLILPLVLSTLIAYTLFFNWISPDLVRRALAFIVATCILSTISSTGLYMATASKELSFFYGAYVPLLTIILPGKMNYYFPLTNLVTCSNTYSWFFSILPYIIIYVLSALAYVVRGGIK